MSSTSPEQGTLFTLLSRPTSAVAWELRTAWALDRVVVLSLSERATTRRLEGRVEQVSATDAFVLVLVDAADPVHVPLADVLAVHRPHYSQHE